ncbi:hypothetical protein F5Y17DRAFT_432139 [Xylariaceae sp. FL0594]|nr:hypothetical protein F5Y17DRAFT_432139 [Xylariaceae sp. FL0594]
MALTPDQVHATQLPLENDSITGFAFPDWSTLDVIGQTILLAELTATLSSFQRACVTLRLLPNEAECFVEAYLDHWQAYERGRLTAQQWGRDLAVPSGDDDDIPQQRPVLIFASSIEPACSFLELMGYSSYAPRVRAWVTRMVIWPPKIDTSDLDILKLNPPVHDFPPPKASLFELSGPPTPTSVQSASGDDYWPVLGFLGRPQPRIDGTPDIRLSFVDIQAGSLVHGPHGVRPVRLSGRYYIRLSSEVGVSDTYQQFLFAASGHGRGQKNGGTGTSIPSPSRGDLAGGDHITHTLGSSQAPVNLPRDLTVDPKAIFWFETRDRCRLPLRIPDSEPRGPSRTLACPALSQLWQDWPGPVLQFRLHRNYRVIGPRGDLHTFDPPQYNTYDHNGNPQGSGGTYTILPPHTQAVASSIKMNELPVHVAFRLNVTERTVLLRNSLLSPRFIEEGAHEWSTREGFLDLYSAHGCYEAFGASEIDRCNRTTTRSILTLSSFSSTAGSGLKFLGRLKSRQDDISNSDGETARSDGRRFSSVSGTRQVADPQSEDREYVETDCESARGIPLIDPETDESDEDYCPGRPRRPRRPRKNPEPRRARARKSDASQK